MGLPIKPKTPKKISASVKALIKSLALTESPKFLDYTHRSDSYRATYCFNNCEEESVKTGASIVYGWQIWEDKKKGFIEAEFHSVIVADGKMLDISPRETGDKKILFVPDKARRSGRKNDRTWISWSNQKMINGILAEEARELEIYEIDRDYSEVRTVL
ncbi:hypothetical protein E0D86_09990 [Pseudomonas sp. IC_126]|uniref:hypothetical protein n=1 Tax=Pseudomonas sp. IC_126 TaxID=2547400 RepID=UPI00103B4C95|nr:hypothetical protein [Pseudomonas sp. IC_126]TCD22950.1 hypothetical protein E0D86_09990 [Pseudomonas sp. IC_126]